MVTSPRSPNTSSSGRIVSISVPPGPVGAALRKRDSNKAICWRFTFADGAKVVLDVPSMMPRAASWLTALRALGLTQSSRSVNP